MFVPVADIPSGGTQDAVPLAMAHAMQRVTWQAEGHALEQLAHYAARADAEFAALEVAALFRMSVRAARQRLDLAVTLTARLPRTLAAMKDGRLDGHRARTIADAVALLSDQDAAAVESEVVDQVEDLAPAPLRRLLTRAIRRLDATALERRHEKRVAERRVDAYPTEDGCAALTVHGAAARVQIADRRVDAIARRLRDTGASEGRTLDQLRADVALDLLAGKDYDNATVTVLLTMPATTALGVDGRPAHLVGYGDIPARQAIDLAYHTDATWRRILTEPATGRVLDVGRRRYRPPIALRDHVRADSPTCTGPGCSRPAQQCDLDHRVPFPEGTTSKDNLHPACRRHHRAKTLGGWRTTKDRRGLLWISPCGYRYRHQPDPIADPEPAPPF